MEKIKNILRSHKDDDTTNSHDAAHSTSTSGAPTASTGAHEPEQKEHGILRQLLNPAGDKYDEQAFGAPTGSTATSDAGLGAPAAENAGRKQSVVDLDNVDQLRTDPEAKKNEHGVLRQILNPHGLKYDDQAFGVTAKEVGADGLPEHSGKGPGELFTHPEVEQKDRGVLRQIINPGGEKYDETRYGTTAVANAPLDATTSGTPGSIAPLPSKIESTEAAEDDRGVLRQLINPGGDRHDDMRYGETGVSAQGTASITGEQQDGASVMSVKSGRLGPYASNTDSNTVGSEQTTTASSVPSQSQNIASGNQATDRSFPLAGGATSTGGSALPDRTVQAPSANDSVFRRDAEIGAGAGAGALGAGALGATAAESHTYPSSSTADQTGSSAVGSTYTARSFPVGGSSTTAATSNPLHAGDELASSGITAPLPTPAGTGSEDIGSATHGSQGHNAALGTGVGVAGGAGLAAYERSLEPKQDVADATYTYSSQQVGGVGGHHDDEKPVEGYVHHTHGPHATDTANMLDPHVPGEFPTESGEDRHSLGNREAAIIGGAGVGMAGIGAAGYEAGKPHSQPAESSLSQTSAPTSTIAGTTTTASTLPSEPEQQQQQRHYGRDAALVGGAGVGAAGLGVAGSEASRLGDEPPTAINAQPSSSVYQPISQTTPGPSQVVGGSAPIYDQSSSSTAPLDNSTTEQSQDPQHHYARDAALASGAGAAGAGAYEATQGRGDTGPASKTVGPHESNIANIVDPRVQPQPEKMKDHTTTGPYQSDTLNKVDPRVKSDSSKNEQPRNEAQHNRDTAEASSVGPVEPAGPGAYSSVEKQEHNKLPASTEHSHNKLHKRDDPRGPTGASNVIHDRHEQKLQEAREAEAAKAHERADPEHKPSLIQRILHPGQHKHDKDAAEGSPMSPQDTETPTSRTHIGNEPYQTSAPAQPRGTDATGQQL